MQVILENRGDIDVDFSLIDSPSLFGPLFRFSLTTGRLKVGEEIKIDVHFEPDVLGDVYEEFSWKLEGSPEPLTLTFKGKVIGPSVHLDVNEVNFEKVAYGFSTKTNINLINSSRIPVQYVVRIEGDSTQDQEDFKIPRPFGRIEDLKSSEIEIEFFSSQVKSYHIWLIVDIEKVAKEVIRIPIKASVAVPDVSYPGFSPLLII